jgi:Flp pilus assembly protein TadD
LDIGPEGILQNYFTGVVRGARGEFTEAIRALEKTISIEPGLASAHAMLAAYHYQLDETQRARDELDQAIALSPTMPGSEYWIAGYFHMSGDFESAEKYMLKALEADMSPENYLELAKLHSLQGRPVEARKALEEAEKLGGNQVQIALSHSFQAVQERNVDEAQSVVLKALQAQPDNPDLLGELSFIHLHMGQLQKAVQEAEKSVQLNPYSAYNRTELAYAYQALGSLDKAIAEARRAVALLPKNDRAHFILGLSLMKKGMEEEGRKELESFLDLYYEREYVNADRQKALELLGRSE